MVKKLQNSKCGICEFWNDSALLMISSSTIEQVSNGTTQYTTSYPSHCTQSWTLSVVNRWRSSVVCWQHLATFTVTKCCQQLQTDDCRLFLVLSDSGRNVAKFSKSRILDKLSWKCPYFWRYSNFLKTQRNITYRNLKAMQKPRSVQPFCYNAGLCRQTDRQTHTSTANVTLA